MHSEFGVYMRSEALGPHIAQPAARFNDIIRPERISGRKPEIQPAMFTGEQQHRSSPAVSPDHVDAVALRGQMVHMIIGLAATQSECRPIDHKLTNDGARRARGIPFV